MTVTRLRGAESILREEKAASASQLDTARQQWQVCGMDRQ
jgi:hypothetical protein